MKSPKKMFGYGLLAATAATVLAAFSPAVVTFTDLRVYDAMAAAATSRHASSRVATVVIDDRSLKEVGQWPWARDVVATLVERVRALGASVVALDMLLAEPDRFQWRDESRQGGSDSRLAATLAAGRVVVGYAFTFGAGAEHDRACVIHPADPVVVDAPGEKPVVEQLFRASGIVCSLPAMARAAGTSGFLNASPDRDGLLRRIPLLIAFDEHIYPSLAFAAATTARGSRLLLRRSGRDRASLRIDDLHVPLDARGTMLIRFRGTGARYRRISATDVLHQRVAGDALKDRIVFVGATALGVQDVMATPVDSAMPGIEVHAAAADTLLQGDFLFTPPYEREYGLAATLVLALATAGIVMVGGFTYGGLICLAMLGAFWSATFLVLRSSGTFLSPLYPTIGVFLQLATLMVTNLRQERRRADTEQTRRERAHRFVTESLTALVETRDTATGQHARRTQEYSRVLARRLAARPRFRRELTPERVELLAELSPLHDIGKVGVPDSVLNKPGTLSEQELAAMRRHPVLGHDALARAERLSGVDHDEALLQLAKDIVYTHHERWDGRGYPRGLKGEEIPIAGRIVALVDVYDALSNSRAYHSSLTHDEAVETIVAGRGTHFDPDVVDAFLGAAEQFRQLSLLFRNEQAGG